MVASHPADYHGSAFERVGRALRILRHMTPPHDAEDCPIVNWGVVLTNAVGVVIGLALTASVSGVVYLVWRVPAQEDAILRGQAQAQETMRILGNEIERLEKNDRTQDERLVRIESGRR